MLHFNQRGWFKFLDEVDHGETHSIETLPEPRSRKEFYLSLLAGNTPTNKKVIYNGRGTNPKNVMYQDNTYVASIDAVINPGIEISFKITKVFLNGVKCNYEEPQGGAAPKNDTWYIAENDSDRTIIICERTMESLGEATVYIVNETQKTPPQPKTVTEFYLAKMAGVEIVGHLEKMSEQEFTFGTEPDGKGYYNVTISNAYDNLVDISRLIAHIDRNDDDPSFTVTFSVDLLNSGIVVNIRTSDSSYAGTTHTLEVFYNLIEDVPVKTRTEQYLKAIAMKQDSKGESAGRDMGRS